MNPKEHPLPEILKEIGYTVLHEGWCDRVANLYTYKIKGTNPYWHRISWWSDSNPYHLVMAGPDKWIRLEEPTSIEELKEVLDHRTRYPDCLDNEGNKQYLKDHGRWPPIL